MKIETYLAMLPRLADEAEALADAPVVHPGSRSGYDFEGRLKLWPPQFAGPMPGGCDRILVHHQGGHMGFDDLVAWQTANANGSYHEYVEHGKVYQLIDPRRHAWHAHEGSADRARWLGVDVRNEEAMPGRVRGDFGALGMCLINSSITNFDEDALGRKWLVPDEVVETAMWRIADLWESPPPGLRPYAPVFTHFEMDPGGKPTDPVGSVTSGMLAGGAAAILMGRRRKAAFQLSPDPSALVAPSDVSGLIVEALRAAADRLEGV